MAQAWRRMGYHIGLAAKAAEALVETAAGIVCLSAKAAPLQHFLIRLTDNVLTSDPDDWLASRIRVAFAHLSGSTKLFAGIFLIAHGAVKLLLVASLLRRRRWAFRTAIVVLWAFVVAQLWRFFVTHGVLLVAVAVFDAVVAVLVWWEYKRQGADEPSRGARSGGAAPGCSRPG